MPTSIRSRPHVATAFRPIDVAPVVIVVLLSLLFAGAVWSAFTPKPIPDASTASIQGGL